MGSIMLAVADSESSSIDSARQEKGLLSIAALSGIKRGNFSRFVAVDGVVESTRVDKGTWTLVPFSKET